MVSIRVWIDEHRIITTRRQRLLSVQDLATVIDASQGPRTPAEFLIMLNDQLINRIGDAVDNLESEVDALEEAVLTEESYQLRPKIAEVRREAILLRRYLAPQRDALYRLQTEDTKWLTTDNRLHLRESNDRIIRFIEDLDSARERSAVTQEELSSKLSEQLDKRMYVLSLVAVIFLPLTFITGLLGINVEGIPGAKYHSAFAVVCGILVVIFVGLYAAFKRKKWM
jgi:zinc transporter